MSKRISVIIKNKVHPHRGEIGHHNGILEDLGFGFLAYRVVLNPQAMVEACYARPCDLEPWDE